MKNQQSIWNVIIVARLHGDFANDEVHNQIVFNLLNKGMSLKQWISSGAGSHLPIAKLTDFGHYGDITEQLEDAINTMRISGIGDFPSCIIIAKNPVTLNEHMFKMKGKTVISDYQTKRMLVIHEFEPMGIYKIYSNQYGHN
jgi:hypothetical protein